MEKKITCPLCGGSFPVYANPAPTTDVVIFSEDGRIVLVKRRNEPHGFALPGGEYTALRIELGGAQGRNWFCVLYPALCLSGAQSDYPTKAENALVFGRYEVRFALAELVGRMASPSGEADSGPAR